VPLRAAGPRPETLKLALASDTEQITAMLVEALERSGYIKPLTAASAKTKVRRLVRRLNLGARDAPVVLGMLRQILWKLEGG
jgi:tRNA C32,U32 (ribose-2'-O)-methylase TrmJ